MLVGVLVAVFVFVGVFVDVLVFVGVFVVVGVGVSVGHTIEPFKKVLHSSQSLKTRYDSNNTFVLGTALATLVQALKPVSVVSKKVSSG